MDYSLPGSSIHGILQARISEWVAMPFSRLSSQTGGRSHVSHVACRFLTIWATREALYFSVKSFHHRHSLPSWSSWLDGMVDRASENSVTVWPGGETLQGWGKGRSESEHALIQCPVCGAASSWPGLTGPGVKGRHRDPEIANILWIIEKAREFRNTSILLHWLH